MTKLGLEISDAGKTERTSPLAWAAISVLITGMTRFPDPAAKSAILGEAEDTPNVDDNGSIDWKIVVLWAPFSKSGKASIKWGVDRLAGLSNGATVASEPKTPSLP